MKTTQITFYKVGLNETNFAYNAASFFNILNAGFLGVVDLTAPLAFGQPFNISTDDFFNYRNATYIRITNIYDNNEFEDRHAFINNFLELANGNFAVSYELDDWANFYLSGKYPNIEFDGFTERANVPLLKDGKIDLTLAAENEREKHNDVIKFYELSKNDIYNQSGESLPAGFKCRVYFLNQATLRGAPLVFDGRASGRGSVDNYDLAEELIEELPRQNSIMAFVVIDSNGSTVPVVQKDTDGYTLIHNATVGFEDIGTTSNVNKYIDFDFLPVRYSDNNPILLENIAAGTLQLNYAVRLPGIRTDPVDSEQILKQKMADVAVGYYVEEHYIQGVLLEKFAPVVSFNINDTLDVANELRQDANFVKATTYNDYINKSLYSATSEAVTISVKVWQAQMDIPANEITDQTQFYAGISGDGETVYIKVKGLKNQEPNNVLTASAQNDNLGEIGISQDYRAYKNAKITGTASVIASTAGAVVGLASSVATGNVAGVVGSLAGGAQGLIAGQQRLQGLTPIKQNGGAGDITITQIADGNKIYITITRTAGAQGKAEIKQLERYGVATTIDFAEYLRNCQMQAYNAVKCAYMGIHNIPQQAARRISETLVAGVTLWTAVDVGNKDVINYQLETEG